MDLSYFRSDLHRLGGGVSIRRFLGAYVHNRPYRVVFWYRAAQMAQSGALLPLGVLMRIIFKSVSRKSGIDIPLSARIGHGLVIWHGYGLVVSADAVIGDNAMLAHGVTIGTERKGHPTIGNRVRIAAGAKVIGGVRIGDDAVVGANCVVTKDVPPGTVAVGVPNRNVGKYTEFVDRHFWVKV